jgi:hypothetical protein
MKRSIGMVITVLAVLVLAAGVAFPIGQSVNTAISPVGSYNQVAVDNTATLITAAGGRVSIIVRNIGAADVYIGLDNSVTTSTGFLLQTSGKESVTLDRTTSAIYAICGGSDNTTVSYIKE